MITLYENPSFSLSGTNIFIDAKEMENGSLYASLAKHNPPAKSHCDRYFCANSECLHDDLLPISTRLSIIHNWLDGTHPTLLLNSRDVSYILGILGLSVNWPTDKHHYRPLMLPTGRRPTATVDSLALKSPSITTTTIQGTESDGHP